MNFRRVSGAKHGKRQRADLGLFGAIRCRSATVTAGKSGEVLTEDGHGVALDAGHSPVDGLWDALAVRAQQSPDIDGVLRCQPVGPAEGLQATELR
jgi:hypothetical protein